jgi:hypothetical protein
MDDGSKAETNQRLKCTTLVSVHRFLFMRLTRVYNLGLVKCIGEM